MLAGTWTMLTNLGPNTPGQFGRTVGTPLLLTNGTIMIQGGDSVPNWYQLTPDATGGYINGTWSALAPMSIGRLYTGTAVLPSGKVFEIGGEYSGPQANLNFTNTAEIYDPASNTWTPAATFPQPAFGDDPVQLLNNGKILAGFLAGPQTYLYDPATNAWSAGGTKLRNDQTDEEAWVKLPDGSIVSYDIFSSINTGVGHAQRYIPATNKWIDAGTVPVLLSSAAVADELGPGLLLPDGRVFQIGGNSNTALYTPSTNTWVAGPTIPNGKGADDAPAAILPNGHVIFAGDTPYGISPTQLFDFDPTANTITQMVLPAGLSASLNINPAFIDRMLVLPSGDLLFSDGFAQLWDYNPNAAPTPGSQPTLSTIVANGGLQYTLTGLQLNGISEGSSYGDDVMNASNYPIVRYTDGSGHVSYATTSNWSSPGAVATGPAPQSVDYTAPASSGAFLVSTIANGIASTPTLLVPLNATNNNLTLQTDAKGNYEVLNGGVSLGSFAPGSFNQVIVAGAKGDTTAVTINVENTLPNVPLTINEDDGTATVNISAAAQTLDNVQGNITINKGSGTDTLNVFDTNTANPTAYTVTANSVSRVQAATISAPGQSAVNLFGGTGQATANVKSTSAPTTITAGGPLTVNVGSAGSVQGIAGALSLHGPTGALTLNLDDSADSTARTVSLLTASLPAGQSGQVLGLAPATIDFVLGAVNSATLSGGSAANVLTGPSAATTWSISGNNAGTVTLGSKGIAFGGFGSLAGGSISDNFLLAGGSLTGSLTGGGGAETLTGPGAGSATPFLVTVNSVAANGAASGTTAAIAGGFSGVNNLAGVAGRDILTGPANPVWNLTGIDAGTLNGSLTFTGFEVRPLAPTTLGLSLNPATNLTFGQTLTLSAAVNSLAGVGTPPGSVTFLVDKVPVTVAVAAGVAGVNVPGLNVGQHSISASYTSSSNDFANSAAPAPVNFNIGKAVPNVGIASAGGVFTGTPQPALPQLSGSAGPSAPVLEGVAPLLTYYAGSSATGTPLSGPPTNVGTYTVVPFFPGSTSFTATAGTPVTFAITPATPSISVSDTGGPFRASAYPGQALLIGSSSQPQSSLEGVTPTLTYYAGTNVNGAPLAGAPSAVGTYTVVATFPGSANYGGASVQQTFSITIASAAATISDAGGVYSGNTFPATAQLIGASGQPTASLDGVSPQVTYYAGTIATGATLSGVPRTVGTYTALATFPGSINYAPASATVTFTVTPATPTVAVSDVGGTYNGNPFPATAQVAFGGGALQGSLEGVLPSLTYYAGSSATGKALAGAPTAVGTYTVVATFPGSADFAPATATQTFTIAPATPSVSVADTSGTYTGNPFAGTAQVTGVAGPAQASLEGVSPTLSYYAGSSATGTPLAGAPTSVGTYTVVASFAGSADYAPASVAQTLNITPATPSLAISSAGGTFTGSPLPSTAPVTGVSGTAQASLEGASATFTYYPGTSATGTPLGSAPSAVGVYTVAAAFPGSADYTPATATATFSITPATPTVGVSDAGGTFTGSAFPATAQVTGTNGLAQASLEKVTPNLTYYAGSNATGTPLAGAPTSVGTYTVLAAFVGSANYTPATATATFSITKATPTVAVSDAGGTYSGKPFPASAQVTGADGNPQASLEGVSPTFTYYPGSSATGTPLGTAPAAAGTYTVVASFGGSADYTAASNALTFTIAKTAPTITVTDPGGTFTGGPFPATGFAAGVDGKALANLEGVGPTLTYFAGSTATGTPLTALPTAAGTYTVVAAFAGSPDYTAGTSSPLTFTIAKLTPLVTLQDAGGTYNGGQFPATASLTGITGSPQGSLEGISSTLTYFAGSNNSGTPLQVVPSAAGIYTVVASFAGSANYKAATSNPLTFTITPATPTVQASNPSGPFTGNPVPAIAQVSGVTGSVGPTLENVSPVLTYFAGNSGTGSPLAGPPTSAGTYTVVAGFPGSADYAPASATQTYTITPITPAITISAGGGTFTGNPFAASAQVTGVGGTAQGSLEQVNPTFTYYTGSSATGTPLAGAPSGAGIYTAVAGFPGSSDYTPATSAALTFTIVPALPTLTIAAPGGTFTGKAIPATAQIAGVSGPAQANLEAVTPTLTYFSGGNTNGSALKNAPATSGTYTVLAAFPGSADYGPASLTQTFTITPATPTVTVAAADSAFTGKPVAATAQVAGTDGNAQASLESVTPTLTYYAGSKAAGTPLGGAPTAAGTYTVVAAFPGSANYTLATSGPATFTIAPPPVTASTPSSTAAATASTTTLPITTTATPSSSSTPKASSSPIVITTPGQVTAQAGVVQFPISVNSQTRTGTLTVRVFATRGKLHLHASGVTVHGNNTRTMTISGPQALVKSALGKLSLSLGSAHGLTTVNVTISDGQHKTGTTVRVTS